MELSLDQGLALAVQLAMGVSLAACAGLRAFLPVFVVGLAGRLEWIPLSSSFDWLASNPALVVFGAAVVTELLADKLPVVDHALDTLQTFVKPIAGVIVVAGVVAELSPLQATVLGIVVGGPAAGIVHILKAKLRLLSTITTAGMGNPVISTAEDAGVLVGSVAAIVVPVVAFLLLLLGVVVLALVIRRVRQRPAARVSIAES